MAQEQKVRLTNARVKDLKSPAEKASWHYDATVQGFAVTVSPLGKKSFYWVGRERGRVVRRKLGTFPEILVDAARKAALAIHGDIARGREVTARKRVGQSSVDDLFDHFLESHAKQAKRTWERNVRDYNALIKPRIGRKLAASITKDDIRRLMTEIASENGRSPAHRAHSILGTMFSIGANEDWVSFNPVTGVKRPKFEPRERYLQAGDLSKFFRAVGQLQSRTAADVILVALFTGARRTNVCTMRWSEIDLHSGTWRIPGSKAKSKKRLTLPLTKYALEIVRAREGNGSEWVFPSPRKPGAPYSEPQHAIEQLRKLSGLDGLSFHDLRRSFGAWMQDTGANLKTIAEGLGHADIRTTSTHYTPTEISHVRKAAEHAISAMHAAAGE